MKRVILFLMAFLLTTGLASAQQAASEQAVISAKETSFDFGKIKESAGFVSHASCRF